jgi:hypothetical protein
MDQLTTVFEIASGSNGVRADALFRMGIGVVGVIAGVLGLFRATRSEERFRTKLVGPVFMMVWSVVWLIAHIPFWKVGVTQTNRLLDVYRNGQSQVVEGIVHVSHAQPANGHASGDKIAVGGQTFEVNYFRVTPGYKQTISHGGALREGVFARLHHHDGVILKVEIGNKRTGQPDRPANRTEPVRSETNRTAPLQ